MKKTWSYLLLRGHSIHRTAERHNLLLPFFISYFKSPFCFLLSFVFSIPIDSRDMQQAVKTIPSVSVCTTLKQDFVQQCLMKDRQPAVVSSLGRNHIHYCSCPYSVIFSAFLVYQSFFFSTLQLALYNMDCNYSTMFPFNRFESIIQRVLHFFSLHSIAASRKLFLAPWTI